MAYRCLQCTRGFAIEITDAESSSSLDPARRDACPTCNQVVGTGTVDCRKCGQVFVLSFPHWHVACDLAGGECPACGAQYVSACIC